MAIPRNKINPILLIKRLHDKEGGRIIYVPNRGNVGDALIASATWQMFEKNELSVDLYHDHMEIDERDMLVYGGGGNLIPNYNDARNFIMKYHQKVHTLVVLPHTINGHSDLLSRLGPNVHLFCREDVSYDYVCRQAVHANAYRYDDIALQLDIKDLNVPVYDLIRISKNYRKGFYNLYHDAFKALKRDKNLYCFRNDREATEIDYEEVYNIDVSSYFFIGYMNGKNITHILSKYALFIINKFEKIYTNRLHICVGGYLLNKEVLFYPNSYYKNKAVFESSLKNLSDKIIWMNTNTVDNK